MHDYTAAFDDKINAINGFLTYFLSEKLEVITYVLGNLRCIFQG